MRKVKILVTGANGQLGSILTNTLRNKYGEANVIATDIRKPETQSEGIFEFLNINDPEKLDELIKKHQITQIYHLAAILSAKGESNPLFSWNINLNGFLNVLEAARVRALDKVFYPSSIAVFGPDTPAENTPQNTILNPSTVYGISKLTGEHWSRYYYDRYKVDVRSLRYPGIIGHESLPHGGTTDYAVEIYHEAIKNNFYECFLSEHTKLPMIYMPDAIRATIELMEAPVEQIKTRSSYNLASMSFTPAEVTTAIQKHLPEFTISYKPDFRQAIADSWTDSIDDSPARNDWNWKEAYDLEKMTIDMIENLKKKTKLINSLTNV